MTDAERVLQLLTNASTTQPDMAFVLGLSIRQVQAACEELRRAGHPIISSGDGMRLAQTSAEAYACAEALSKRAAAQWVTSQALMDTARRMRASEDNLARLTLWGEFHEIRGAA